MVRLRVGALLVLCCSCAVTAEAQSVFNGMVTGHIGAAVKGDVREWTVTPGASMAVLDDNGIGVELDLGHSGDIDTVLFEDSSVTSLMLNLMAMYPHVNLRPFVTVGAGVMRLRLEAPGQASFGQTEPGWTAGGGVTYMLNDALGLRGDVRYFRHFQAQPGTSLAGNGVFDFWRSSVGVTFSWPMQ